MQNGRGGSGSGGFGIYARQGDLQIIDNEIATNGCTGIGTEGGFPYILRNMFSPQIIDCVRTGEDVSILTAVPPSVSMYLTRSKVMAASGCTTFRYWGLRSPYPDFLMRRVAHYGLLGRCGCCGRWRASSTRVRERVGVVAVAGSAQTSAGCSLICCIRAVLLSPGLP